MASHPVVPGGPERATGLGPCQMNVKDALEIFRLPRTTINLMLEKSADNDPFFRALTENFYNMAVARHPKLLVVKRYEFGFALCSLPAAFEMYYANIEASARRNHKKALRLGYAVKRFAFNDRLEDVAEIQRSTPVRQGELPPEIQEGRVNPVSDPPSRSPRHDYPYFGVFKDDKMVAYASCLVAGELCNVTELFGHARYQDDGVVPLLLIEIVRELLDRHPDVKYYAFDTYFGASESMRRFKRKFLFHPYRVTWQLQSRPAAPVSDRMMIYRMDLSVPPAEGPFPEGVFIMAAGVRDIPACFPAWTRSSGVLEAVKTSLKVLIGKRIFFGVLRGQQIAQSGWANLGFCQYYPVEPDAAVLGTLWTSPEFRGRGLAPAALRSIMTFLHQKGCRRFYIDVGASNLPSRRMIEKTGFSQRIA